MSGVANGDSTVARTGLLTCEAKDSVFSDRATPNSEHVQGPADLSVLSAGAALSRPEKGFHGPNVCGLLLDPIPYRIDPGVPLAVHRLEVASDVLEPNWAQGAVVSQLAALVQEGEPERAHSGTKAAATWLCRPRPNAAR